MVEDLRKMTRLISCCADCIFYAKLLEDDIICHHPENINVSVGAGSKFNSTFHPDCPLEKA